MRLRATELAQRIGQENGLPTGVVERLAVALSFPVAVVRDGLDVYVVLRDPLSSQPEAVPVLVKGRLSGQKRRRRVTTTKSVRYWFKDRCRSLSDERPPGHTRNSWAPAATLSLAPVPIGGDLGSLRGLTDDPGWEGGQYAWYDLNDVEIGGCIYRLDSKGTLWLFQRVSNKSWAKLCVPNCQPLVDMAAVLRGIEARDQSRVESLLLEDGDMELLREPPPGR